MDETFVFSALSYDRNFNNTHSLLKVNSNYELTSNWM